MLRDQLSWTSLWCFMLMCSTTGTLSGVDLNTYHSHLWELPGFLICSTLPDFLSGDMVSLAPCVSLTLILCKPLPNPNYLPCSSSVLPCCHHIPSACHLGVVFTSLGCFSTDSASLTRVLSTLHTGDFTLSRLEILWSLGKPELAIYIRSVPRWT